MFELKKEAVRGTTVEVVPKEAFDLFKAWFTISVWSKPIWREVAVIDGKKDVEMNPLTFSMCTCGPDGEPRTTKVLLQVRGNPRTNGTLQPSVLLTSRTHNTHTHTHTRTHTRTTARHTQISSLVLILYQNVSFFRHSCARLIAGWLLLTFSRKQSMRS